jgi:hypothetical protein
LLTVLDIRQHGGGELLSNGMTLAKALTNVYPNYNWEPWKFKNQKGIWEDKETRRKYFDMLATRLNITNPTDWYKIKSADLTEIGASTVINNYYKNSLPTAIEELYPEHNILPWKFHQVPKGYWDDKKNQRKFMDWLGQQLHITCFEDWYQIRYPFM